MGVFNIQGKDFPPGSSGLVRLNAGRLPSGNRISIFTYIFRSKNPGPTLLFLGGMHGDEINGVEIVRRAIQDRLFSKLTAGNVIAIPLLNIFGFINFSRDVPDGKDVNRSFPGNLSGSLASRVARLLTKRILPLVDMGIDFHTGSDNHWNYPQLRYSPKHQEARDLALQCNHDLILEKPVLPKSLRKVARDLKKPIIIFEGGEALKLESNVVEKGLLVIKNALYANNMLEGKRPNPPVISRIFKKAVWERAPEGGLVTFYRQSGTYVRRGEVLGIISDPFGQKEVRIYASRDGYLIAHNNAPVVNIGDGMFHVAYEEDRYAKVLP